MVMVDLMQSQSWLRVTLIFKFLKGSDGVTEIKVPQDLVTYNRCTLYSMRPQYREAMYMLVKGYSTL